MQANLPKSLQVIVNEAKWNVCPWRCRTPTGKQATRSVSVSRRVAITTSVLCDYFA